MRTILSLCDYSGVWSRPYEEAGYEVVRIDLQHGRDVRLTEHLGRPVHGVLAAPPCTVFSKAGAWKWGEAGVLDGLSVVDACLRFVAVHRPAFWALENPAGRLRRWLGPPAWAFQPHDFGDPWTKRTYLWGHFTPPTPLFCAAARNPVSVTLAGRCGGRDRTTRFSSRQKNERSETPAGFARAFYEANP